MAQSYGCWQEASIPYTWAFSQGLMDHHNMAAGFPQSEYSKKERKEKAVISFMTYFSGDTVCHHILFVKNESRSLAHTQPLFGRRNLEVLVDTFEICILPRVQQIARGRQLHTQGAQLGALWWPGGVGCRGGWEAQEERDICTLTADSCCLAETNTALWIDVLWLLIKVSLKKPPHEGRREIRENSGDIVRGQLRRVKDG